ncbi:MAG: DUF4149 domain-containing protein [Burkholderiales bacterium]
MTKTLEPLALLAASLWVGGLWAVGFIAAPTLFTLLVDKSLAGLLVGRMFSITAYLGLMCGTLLLANGFAKYGLGAVKKLGFWVVVAMLVLSVIGHFGIAPLLAGLKSQPVAARIVDGVTAPRFAHWHGIASALYVIQSALGVALLLLTVRAK